MKLPKKITPDNLLDTIVELRMQIQQPLELIAGMLAPIFSKIGYQFVSLPSVNLQFSKGNQVAIEIEQRSNNVPVLFVKEAIRVLVAPDRVSINCERGKYVGWTKYSEEIIAIIDAIIKSEIVQSFNRVSIRYVSEYRGESILNKIKYNVVSDNELGLAPREVKLCSLVNNMKIFVTLSDNIARQTHEGETYNASLFDVNIYESCKETLELDTIINLLNKVHDAEKHNFFGLLKDEFINARNPEY